MTRRPAAARGWRAHHLHYHADQDRLLRLMVRPLLAGLVREGVVDRAYFVRYELGGPHVRLRWRATSRAAASAAREALARAAAAFFRELPSTEPVPEETIRRVNRALLGVDPMVRSADDVVRPDNSWRPAPLGLEVERYGGPANAGATLDLFTLSSAEVLGLLERRADGGDRGWTRPAFLRMALHLAWGFAEEEGTLGELAGYGSPFFSGARFEVCRAEGDGAFERRREALVGLVRDELFAADAAGLALGACGLAARVRGLSAAARHRLATGHIHMSANRLGLSNPEEAYLSQMLWRAVDALRRDDPRAWREVRERRAAAGAAAAPQELGARAGRALAELAR